MSWFVCGLRWRWAVDGSDGGGWAGGQFPAKTSGRIQLEISRQIGESESSSEAMMLQLSIQNRHTIRVLVIVDDFMLDFAPSRDICIN